MIWGEARGGKGCLANPLLPPGVLPVRAGLIISCRLTLTASGTLSASPSHKGTASLRLPGAPPLGQLRKHGDGTAVFDAIGDSGTLSERAEPLLVFLRGKHEARVEGEHGIAGSVEAHPDKSLYPGVGGGGTGPFDVRSRGEELALGIEHPGADWDEQDEPSPKNALQYELSEQPAGAQEEKDKFELQSTQGLQLGELRQAWRNTDDQGGGEPENPEQNGRATNAFKHRKVVAASDAPEPFHQEQGTENAQPFVPLPAQQGKIGSGIEYLPVGVGDGREKARGQQREDCRGGRRGPERAPVVLNKVEQRGVGNAEKNH